jgi:hypothetical protein
MIYVDYSPSEHEREWVEVAFALTYRLLAFWLTVVPGVVAYVQPLRSERATVRSGSG